MAFLLHEFNESMRLSLLKKVNRRPLNTKNMILLPTIMYHVQFVVVIMNLFDQEIVFHILMSFNILDDFVHVISLLIMYIIAPTYMPFVNH